jgi:hypothetical protein
MSAPANTLNAQAARRPVKTGRLAAAVAIVVIGKSNLTLYLSIKLSRLA